MGLRPSLLISISGSFGSIIFVGFHLFSDYVYYKRACAIESALARNVIEFKLIATVVVSDFTSLTNKLLHYYIQFSTGHVNSGRFGHSKLPQVDFIHTFYLPVSLLGSNFAIAHINVH